jgi:putative SOS response-associated peptidase YedK
MCGRVIQFAPPRDIAQQFETSGDLPNAAARYNGAPSQDLMVVRHHPKTGMRHVGLLRWGLIPSWAKDRKVAFKMINARCESAATKAAFAPALEKRRCLVPVDGFYEWKSVGKTRQPYAFAMADRRPFALAGLWEWWKDPAGGEEVRSFTVLTTAANALVSPLHDRMPVIVRPENWQAWLSDARAAPELLEPHPADAMISWPVSDRVGSVRNEGPDLLEPVEPLSDPELTRSVQPSLL